VLLVEDDHDARDLIARILRERGAAVTAASSAAEAVDAYKIDRPDLLISDIGMPEEDGYSLLARLRALDAASGSAVARLPAVALTALARAEDRRRAILAGFQVHLAKPIEPAELVATIANLAGPPRASEDPLTPSA